MTGASQATPILVWTRAALLGVVVVTVSCLGHVQADGLLPAPWVLVVLAAGTAAGCAAFLSRQVTTPGMVALLVAGQAGVHVLLTLAAGHHAEVGAAATGHHHGGHVASALSGGGAAMALAHLGAVVVLGLWLGVGERALWTVLTLSAARFQDLAARTTSGPGAALRAVEQRLEQARRGLVLRSGRRDDVPLPHLVPLVGARRGPPALLAV